MSIRGGHYGSFPSVHGGLPLLKQALLAGAPLAGANRLPLTPAMESAGGTPMCRRVAQVCLLAAAVVLAVAGGFAAPQLVRERDRYVLSGTPLEVSWDAATGALSSVRHVATGLELLAGASQPFDLRTDSGSVFTASAARAARLGALVLDGRWDFRVEGGQWQTLKVPGAWEDQGITQVTPDDPDPGWKPYNGNAYYRRTFDLPENLRGQELVLVLQRVDDWDVVTLNGREIGRTGQEVADWWATPRRYPVPPDALKPADNLLEIKVYDRGGEGGLLGSVMLMPANLVAEWEKPLRLASAKLEVGDGLARVTLAYDAPGWQASEVYEVALEEPGFLSRRVVLIPTEEAGTEVFRGGELELGRLGAQIVAQGQIAAPYTWPPVLRPLSDFARAGDVSLHCGSAVTGVGVSLPDRDLAFAVGQYWEQDWNTFYCRGRDGAVAVGGSFQCEGRLRPGLRIPMGGQFVLVSNSAVADWRAAAKAIGEGWRRLGFTRPPVPQWAESIALYSCYPAGTMGGALADCRDPSGKEPPLQTFRRLQLPILKRLGINAIWFLPIWPGLYGPTDYWKIDPSLGSVDDLRAFVQDAHSAGIRVICDLIPHGPQEVSGLAQEHPELIARHEDGSILYWWGCLCCDYAHPGWHDYMARVATHWVREADIDGYRVDCAGGAPQNWRPYEDNLPSWSGQWGGLRMMEKVRAEMEKVKPGCVLLAEAANPPMLSQAQYIYDWPAENVLFHILDTPREEWVAGLRTWLELQRLALPEGAAAGLMRFTENHDQLHSVWQLGPDLARPIWALCALAEGFPLLYHEQEVGFEDFWAELLATRKALPDLHLGAADYVGVTCDKPAVLAFARTYQGRASLVAINFSGRDQECELAWPHAPKGLTRAVAFPGRERLALGTEKGVKVRVSVPKGGWRVVALRGEGEAAALPGAGFEPRPAGPQAVAWRGLKGRVKVRDGGQERSLEVRAGAVLDQSSGEIVAAEIEAEGGWRLVWQDGLLGGLAVGKRALWDGMWVSEGMRQVSWDDPISFGVTLGGEAPGPHPRSAKMQPKSWRVAHAGDGLVLEYEGEGPEFALRTRYQVQAEGVIEAEVSCVPLQASEPVVGQIYVALGAPGAQRWAVKGLEGDVGGPFFVRHPSPNEILGKYWHPIQRLWESSVQPLSVQTPAFGWQTEGGLVWVQMVDYPGREDVEDIYLREYLPDGRPGLAAYLAWMEGRTGRELSPQRPLKVAFRVLVGREPLARRIALPVNFWADGSNWWVENGHYRVCIGRSSGGQLRGAWAASGKEPILGSAMTYTDYGILPDSADSLGNRHRTMGSTSADLEPDCWIEPSLEELRLHFRGYLREGAWTTIARPRVQYETIWHFTGGPEILVEHRVRPLIEPRPAARAFLAQTLKVPQVQGWEAIVGGTAYTGRPDTDPANRVIQSAVIGGAAEKFTLTTARGKVVLGNLKPWGEGPQNCFLLKSNDGSYTIFLAMLDGQPVDLDARWRGYSYTLEVTGR